MLVGLGVPLALAPADKLLVGVGVQELVRLDVPVMLAVAVTDMEVVVK